MAFETQTSTLAPNHRLEASLNILSVNPNGSFTFEFVLAIRRDGGTGVNGSFNLSLHEGIRPTGGDSGSTTLFNYDLRTVSYQELARFILTRTPSGPQTSIFYAITNEAGGSNTFGPVDLTVTADIPAASPASFPSFSPASFVAGTPISISWTAAQSTYRHTLRYSFGPDVNFEIESGIVGSRSGYSYTPPAYLLSYIPDAPSAPYTISLETFTAGGTSLGVRTVTGELRAPSTGPAVTAVSVSDTNTAVSTQVGAFVQGLSVLRLDGITATAPEGATVVERRLDMASQNLRIGETRALLEAGTRPYTARAWDSRGREGSLAGSVNVLPYAGPSLSVPTLSSPTGDLAYRSDSSGEYDPDGENLSILYIARAASLVNGTQRNSITIRISTKAIDGDTWTIRNTLTPSTTVVDGRLSTGALTQLVGGGAIYSADESYLVRIEVSDEFNTLVSEETVATAYVTIDLNGRNVGVGKLHERGSLDVAGEGFFGGLHAMEVYTEDLDTATFGGDYIFETDSVANAPSLPGGFYALSTRRMPFGSFEGANVVFQKIYDIARTRVLYTRGGEVAAGSEVVTWDAPWEVHRTKLVQDGANTVTGNGTPYSSTPVTFPEPFALPPRVVAGSEMGGSTTNTFLHVAKGTNITTTGFTLQLKGSGNFSSSYSIPWIASGVQ